MSRSSRRPRTQNHITAAAILAVLALSTPVQAAKNLLNNGTFAKGSGNSVDGWRIDAWVLTPGTSDYRWIAPSGGEPAEVEVFSHRDNDARWAQSLNLGPGWYYISVIARTHDVLPFFNGANISVLEDSIMSADLRNDSDWKRLGLYLKIGPKGADIEVALRLGGYMNLTRGQAFFRDAQVVKVPAPPIGATHVFDLEKIRKNEATGPIGHRWTLLVTFALLGITTLIGWVMLSEQSREKV